MTSISIALIVLTVSLFIAAVLSVKHKNERRDQVLLAGLTGLTAGGTVLSFFV